MGLLGILAGLVVTLLGLASMSGPPPGCDYGAGGTLTGIVCLTVAEGAPLRGPERGRGRPAAGHPPPPSPSSARSAA